MYSNTYDYHNILHGNSDIVICNVLLLPWYTSIYKIHPIYTLPVGYCWRALVLICWLPAHVVGWRLSNEGLESSDDSGLTSRSGCFSYHAHCLINREKLMGVIYLRLTFSWLYFWRLSSSTNLVSLSSPSSLESVSAAGMLAPRQCRVHSLAA